jgi:hypothetical protein
LDRRIPWWLDLDATIAVDTCLQPQCSADAAAHFI